MFNWPVQFLLVLHLYCWALAGCFKIHLWKEYCWAWVAKFYLIMAEASGFSSFFRSKSSAEVWNEKTCSAVRRSLWSNSNNMGYVNACVVIFLFGEGYCSSWLFLISYECGCSNELGKVLYEPMAYFNFYMDWLLSCSGRCSKQTLLQGKILKISVFPIRYSLLKVKMLSNGQVLAGHGKMNFVQSITLYLNMSIKTEKLLLK